MLFGSSCLIGHSNSGPLALNYSSHRCVKVLVLSRIDKSRFSTIWVSICLTFYQVLKKVKLAENVYTPSGACKSFDFFLSAYVSLKFFPTWGEVLVVTLLVVSSDIIVSMKLCRVTFARAIVRTCQRLFIFRLASLCSKLFHTTPIAFFLILFNVFNAFSYLLFQLH